MTVGHLPHPNPDLAAMGATLCGRFGKFMGGESRRTCKACRRRVRAHSGIEEELDLSPSPARFGARTLGAAENTAIEASIAPSHEEAAFVVSVDAAARAYFRWQIEGHAPLSTTDPARVHRVQASTMSHEGVEHRRIVRQATVARAISTASRDAVEIGLAPGVSPERVRWIYALVILGKPRRRDGWVQWVPRSPVQIAEEDLEGAVSVQQVLDLAHFFRSAVRSALLKSGELERWPDAADTERPRARRGSFAADPLRRLRCTLGS